MSTNPPKPPPEDADLEAIWSLAEDLHDDVTMAAPDWCALAKNAGQLHVLILDRCLQHH